MEAIKATFQGLLVLIVLFTCLFFSTEEGGDMLVEKMDLNVEKISYKVLDSISKSL